MPHPLPDAHNHLHDPRFGGRREEIIAAMRAAGVAACVVNGTCEDDWPQVARLAERFPGFVRPAFGLHPWFASHRSARWADVLTYWLERCPDASIGECGLDRWVAEPPLEVQREVFATQLTLAAEQNRPVTIHCLKAWEPLIECLHAAPPLPRGFLLHSLGGSRELVARLARHGAMFSCSGHFLHPRKAAALDAFRSVPPDRVLLESDAPDMLPPPEFITHPLAAADGTPLNHPANLPAIAAALAAALERPAAGLARLAAANFQRFFGV
jgi:TatD DNase family protein